VNHGYESGVSVRPMVKSGGRNSDVRGSKFTEAFEGLTFIENGDSQVQEGDGRASDFESEFN